ncbi:hypothetical protein Dsin_020751 [Dipteronia sinensis]|uniref:Uncharacterized protein n=1 Tax=Dipteronia sinensis TaxID=43782 RepID=A0AAE0AA24_9ROSI|nr:hypothetical protein Dsin_020751 [Dipteronia sinensis]
MRMSWAVGEPLMVEEDSLRRRRLDRGRVLILIPVGHKCLDKVKVITGNQKWSISVVEDHSQGSASWILRRLGLSHITSSVVSIHSPKVEDFQNLVEDEVTLVSLSGRKSKVGNVEEKRLTPNPSSQGRVVEANRWVSGLEGNWKGKRSGVFRQRQTIFHRSKC